MREMNESTHWRLVCYTMTMNNFLYSKFKKMYRVYTVRYFLWCWSHSPMLHTVQVKSQILPSCKIGLFQSSSVISTENNSSPLSTTPSGTNRPTPHLSKFSQSPSLVTIFDVVVSKVCGFKYLESSEALFLRDGDISKLSLPYDDPAENNDCDTTNT